MGNRQTPCSIYPQRSHLLNKELLTHLLYIIHNAKAGPKTCYMSDDN